MPAGFAKGSTVLTLYGDAGNVLKYLLNFSRSDSVQLVQELPPQLDIPVNFFAWILLIGLLHGASPERYRHYIRNADLRRRSLRAASTRGHIQKFSDICQDSTEPDIGICV